MYQQYELLDFNTIIAAIALKWAHRLQENLHHLWMQQNFFLMLIMQSVYELFLKIGY